MASSFSYRSVTLSFPNVVRVHAQRGLMCEWGMTITEMRNVNTVCKTNTTFTIEV